MNPQLVAKTWLFYGLTDLYFAFDNDDTAFSDNALFSEIMGLEKIMKAVIIFHHHKEYECMTEGDAKNEINELAKGLGHDFNKMLKDLSQIGLSDIERIKITAFDGHLGSDLIRAAYAGYMETRYPVPRLISQTFPIKGTDLKYDPLSSSGITKFIYAICNACFAFLALHMSLSELQIQFHRSFGHRASFSRFNNLFWEPRCRPAP